MPEHIKHEMADLRGSRATPNGQCCDEAVSRAVCVGWRSSTQHTHTHTLRHTHTHTGDTHGSAVEVRLETEIFSKGCRVASLM